MGWARTFALVVPLSFVASLSRAQDLAPPPPMESSPSAQPATASEQPTAESSQAAALDEGPRKESGRGLEFVWINAEVGGSYIDMEQFSSTTFGLQKSSSSGPMFGLGAGIRLLIFTFGVRARLNELSVFNLWQVNGEAGVHVPIGRLDPYFTLHVGYSFVGRLDSDSLSNATSSSVSDVTIHGVDAGLAVGLDYYFNHFLSLGVDVAVEALFLKRPPVALPAEFNTLPPAEQQTLRAEPLYANSGDSVGFGLAGSAHLGVHF